jgi:hypothetical protein
MNKKVIAVIAVTTALFSVAAARRRTTLPPATVPPLNAARSFAVTDVQLLDNYFSFPRVLNYLVAGSGTSGQQLIRQMFDTQNPRPGKADSLAPHCDDFLVGGAATFNGFPRRCPTPEATLAGTVPDLGGFRPLALINRFDMAPADGANCGQYRMIFATIAQTSARYSRIHLILEAVLPNPHREEGLRACRPVAQFWADLSSIDSQVERRIRLEKFFFDGLDGFEPVVKASHYTAAVGGGIRSRQLASAETQRWRGYQFHIDQQCPGSGLCTLRLVPDVLENLPYGPMFDANNDTAVARAFRENFVAQVPALAVNDLNAFRMNVDSRFLLVESDPLDDFFAFEFLTPFRQSQSSDAGKAFRAQIEAKLASIGSALTPEDIVARAQTQTCNGCHFVPQSIGGGLIFPGALDTNQVHDLVTDNGTENAQSRWATSPAMDKVFLPNRMRILKEFLEIGKAPEHSN